MTALLGRFLQMMGMVLLPAGLMIGLFRNNIGLEVRLLWIGGALFVLGWLLSRKAE